jgi:glycosyltransferase involved in cell wall biosynthesis
MIGAIEQHGVEMPRSTPIRPAETDVWFRVASFPDKTAGNPGLEMFYGGLAAHGIELTTRLVCEPAWIRAHASSLDAIHLHWPEKIWRGKTRGRIHHLARVATFDRYRAVLRFARTLKTAGALGLKRVWTVHNIEPHDGAGWLDRLGYRIAARHSDLLICYSQSAAADVLARYHPRGQVVGIAHGNYHGIYPPPRDREVVLREFGLDPQLPVVCCVGIIKQYKGLDIACDAVRRLSGQVQLAICGAPHSATDTEIVRKEMQGVPGVIVGRALSDREFSDIIGASEAVLLPYRNITGSGSLLGAWTLGRGVIASDLPLFREMLGPEPQAGHLFRADDSASLADAIRHYLSTPAAVRAAAAMRAANLYSWDRTVGPVVKVMRAWKTR